MCLVGTKKPGLRVSREGKEAGDILAEVEKQPFKHQHRACAAENSERLSPKQAEQAPGDRCAQEALQNALVRERYMIFIFRQLSRLTISTHALIVPQTVRGSNA